MATKAAKKTTPRFVYQLKATMNGIRPLIWRKFQVESDANLYHMHLVLQELMGWYDYHLHEFTIDGIYYGDPEAVDMGPNEIVSDKKKRLSSIIGPEQRFLYEYDFGDGWEINLIVEKILPVEKDTQYPVCIKGRRAGPPEDCGGVWGYEKLLGTIRNPDNPEHDEMIEWLGGEFDPEAFDTDEVNAALKNIPKRPGIGGRQPDIWNF